MTETKAGHEDEITGPDEITEPGEAVETAAADEAVVEDAVDETGTDLEDAAQAKELAADLASTQERLLRALAETENLRRRSARELEEARQYAVSGFARELLDVADNLSRALSSIPPRAREEIDFVKTLADGVALTEKMLTACFERHRVAKVEPAPGDKFDHNRHQAMFEIESDQHPPGSVAQVMQPGYVIADRLLRPALVGVAKAPAATAEPDTTATSEGAPSSEPSELEPGAQIDTTA
jgi:molecular chaperone GrpE